MTNDFDDFQGPTADDPGGKKAKPVAVMWLTAPAVNSIELSLRELQMTEPTLDEVEVMFGDDDEVQGEQAPNDPAHDKAQENLQRFYAAHIALARSLGPNATFADYCRAAELHHMKPVMLRDYVIQR
jgi:hypothetical protein